MTLEQAFKVKREWLTGPLTGGHSVFYTRVTFSVGFEGHAAHGRYRVVSVEAAAVEPLLLSPEDRAALAGGL